MEDPGATGADLKLVDSCMPSIVEEGEEVEEGGEEEWIVSNSPLVIGRGSADCNDPLPSLVMDKEKEGWRGVSNSPRTVESGRGVSSVGFSVADVRLF